MKTYQFILNVPDDFDPEDLELNINYEKGDIGIIGEGFYNNTDEIVKELASKAELQLVQVKPTDAIIFKYSGDLSEDVGLLLPAFRQSLENQFGCTVVGIVNDIDLMIQDSAQSIKMLQQMIDKINSKAIVKVR